MRRKMTTVVASFGKYDFWGTISEVSDTPQGFTQYGYWGYWKTFRFPSEHASRIMGGRITKGGGKIRTLSGQIIRKYTK
jgi:hypothetical protein